MDNDGTSPGIPEGPERDRRDRGDPPTPSEPWSGTWGEPAGGTQPGRPTWERGRPVPLRPMGVGEMLDAAINLYRLHWKTLMAIVAFVVVPVTFLQELWTSDLPTTDPFAGFDPETGTGVEFTDADARFLLGSGVFGLLWFLVIQPFLTAATVRAVAGAYMGETPTVAPVYRFALSRLRSVLWVIVLTFVSIGVLAFVGVLVGVVTAAIGLWPIAVPVFIATAVFVILLAVRWLFGPSVLVVEGERGIAALGRSWRLSQGKFWKIVGTYLLASILAGIVSTVVGVIPGLISGGLGAGGWLIGAIGGSLASIVTTPFTTMIVVLLYFDLRIRKEGLDLQVMAQEIRSSET